MKLPTSQIEDGRAKRAQFLAHFDGEVIVDSAEPGDAAEAWRQFSNR